MHQHYFTQYNRNFLLQLFFKYVQKENINFNDAFLNPKVNNIKQSYQITFLDLKSIYFMTPPKMPFATATLFCNIFHITSPNLSIFSR